MGKKKATKIQKWWRATKKEQQMEQNTDEPVQNPDEEFNITIKMIGSEVVPIIVSVKLTDNLDNIKDKIQDLVGIAHEQYHLLFKGKKLERHFTIQAFYIKPDSLIHMVITKQSTFNII